MRRTKAIFPPLRVCRAGRAIFGGLVISATLATQSCAQTVPIKFSPAEYHKTLVQAQAQMSRGEFDKAAGLYEQLTASYPDDPVTWEDLAHSRSQLKQYDAAARAFEKALSLKRDDLLAFDLAFDYYRIARMYAQADDKRNAIVWLGKAVTAGFERRSELSQDPVFASLRGDPLFAEISGSLPARNFSRNDGWRYDLGFLVSEIKRLHYLYRGQPLPTGLSDSVKKLDERISSLTDEQIVVQLQGLMARIGDGHTILFTSSGKHPLKQLPVNWHLFSDGLYITGAPEDLKKLVGSRVVKIGETDPAQALARLAPYISRDNPMFIKAMGTVLFLRSPDFLHAAGIISDPNRVSLTLESREGRLETIALTPVPAGPLKKPLTPSELPNAPPPPLYMRRQADLYWFEQLSDSKTVYFQFNLVVDKPDETLSAFALRLRKFLNEQPVQNLIVDVRHNYGGNERLLPPLLRTLINFETSRPNGRLFVITSRATYSAAQVFVAQVSRLTGAVFAGEPSSSSPNFIGEDIPVALPYSGLYGSISSRYHQSDMFDRRIWIAPSIPVTLSSKEYFSNQDPTLDVVLQIIREGQSNQ